MSSLHDLKTWPEFFAQVLTKTKTFEIRRDDRTPEFALGDQLLLREWDPKDERFTGRSAIVRVTSILRGEVPGLQEGYIAMSFELEWSS